MRVKVDATQLTYLGLCGCGDRFLALSRCRALERLAQHETEQHPDDTNARASLANYRRRHPETASDTPVR